MIEQIVQNYHETGYVVRTSPLSWVGEVPIGEGSVYYSISQSEKDEVYEGEITVFLTPEKNDYTKYRFSPHGLTTGYGVIQIEASAESLLCEIIRLDNGRESDRGYAMFCELAAFLPPSD